MNRKITLSLSRVISMKLNAKSKENIINVDKESVSAKNLKIQKRTINESDSEAAKTLSMLWKDYKDNHSDVCQKTFAAEKFGWSQGLFSQYLTGKVPISLKNALKFAEVFDCDPGDIRTEFRSKKMFDLNKKMASQLAEVLVHLKDDHGMDVSNNDLCKRISETLSSPSLKLSIEDK